MGCVGCQSSLHRAYHSSRGDIPSGVRLCVNVKPVLWGGPGLLGAVVPMEENTITIDFHAGPSGRAV